jgi:hypothetical protein
MATRRRASFIFMNDSCNRVGEKWCRSHLGETGGIRRKKTAPALFLDKAIDTISS